MIGVIKQMLGKKVDVNCGAGVSFSGEAIDVKDDVMILRESEDMIVYISAEKIISISEKSEAQARPGFIG